MPDEAGPGGGVRGHALAVLAYLALWTAVSWPLATVPFTERLVTRQFDLYASMWLVDVAPGTFPRMVSVSSGWPLHEVLTRVDSYVLLGLGWLNHGLLSGRALCGLVACLGVPLSAAAAERCAHDGFGVARPWSWIAGLAYGFSGIAATALLEGHVYDLLNPWLPLLWWGFERGARGDATRRAGLIVGAAFAAALYTSAYFGVFALMLLIVLSLDAPRVAVRIAPGVALIALPAGVYYLWLFRMSSRFLDTDATSPALYLRMGTVAASQLIGWDPLADVATHSITAALPLLALPLALGVVALPRRTRLLPLLLAALGVIVALGRTWHLDPGDGGLDLPVDRLLIPALAWFRFPVRALWLTGLVVGVQAARTLGALAPRAPRLAAGALILAVADAILGPGLPWRLAAPIGEVPSAYAAIAPGAVLDLWAEPADRSSGELEMWSRNLTCWYAGVHGHATPEVCIGTGVKSPREVLDAWLTHRLLAGNATNVPATLSAMGFSGVALHVDLFRPADADILQQALTSALGVPLATSTDGGETVVAYAVPAASGPVDAPAVYQRIAAEK